jgi:hypothetical protein
MLMTYNYQATTHEGEVQDREGALLRRRQRYAQPDRNAVPMSLHPGGVGTPRQRRMAACVRPRPAEMATTNRARDFPYLRDRASPVGDANG